jgi:hypothetical protein
MEIGKSDPKISEFQVLPGVLIFSHLMQDEHLVQLSG